MILFLDDWKRFPNAIIDTQTTNQSFLRMAQLFKSMGIKNHAFLLALMQPDLQGVDPHDPNITLEQKAMIGLECKYNPWYFFREVVRIPAVAGPVAGKFRANRGNIALIWAFLCSIDAANIQPRQTGKSTSTDCIMVWLTYIGAGNTMITMITKDDALRRSNVDRLKAIRNLLPKYLVNTTREDSDNQFELTCKALKNSYKTGVSQNSESAANNLGRGLTSPILHCDEGPFINFIGVTLPAALAAGTAARDEAVLYNRPHGNIFTTTAGKKDDRDGKFMYDLIHGGATWDETYYDCFNKKILVEMVESNGSGGAPLLNITMSHRQLGYTDEWLKQAILKSRATGEAADRDFLNVWTSGTQRSPLSTALNEIIRASEREVLHSEITDRYILRWFVAEEEIMERMAEGHYVIGMDTSEAINRDAIGLVITDVRDLSVVAAGTYNETNIFRFSGYVFHLLMKYTNTTLVMERKSTGGAIMDFLIQQMMAIGADPFRRIYNRIVDEGDDEDMRDLSRRPEYRTEQFYDQRGGKFGFMTTKESRSLLYGNVLQEAAKKAGHLVADKMLSSEIRGLVEKNGRIDHATSGHDDMVVSWLLTHWFITYGRNLGHYGINSSMVMSQVSELGRQMSEEELTKRENQGIIMEEIDDLLDKLRNCRDDMMVMKHEHRLRYLQMQVGGIQTDEAATVDALIQQAREERTKRVRMDSQQRRSGANRELGPLRHANLQRPGFLGAPGPRGFGNRAAA